MRKNLPDWVGLLKAERNSKKTLRCYPPEQSRLEGKSRCPPGNRNQLWRLSAWECEEVNSFILKQYFKASVMFFYWGFFLYFCKTLKRKLTFLPLSPPYSSSSHPSSPNNALYGTIISSPFCTKISFSKFKSSRILAASSFICSFSRWM